MATKSIAWNICSGNKLSNMTNRWSNKNGYHIDTGLNLSKD